jgi:DnaK suppressor protein
MTKIELAKYKSTLTGRLNELTGLTRNREAAAIETSADALDQIQHMVEREMAMEKLGRESTFLRETRKALDRIGTGIYGICVDCEEEINPKRLAAVPWAARCIVCQERTETERVTHHDAIAPVLIEAAA